MTTTTNITGTVDAFYYMLSKRGIYKTLQVDRRTVSGWKKTQPSLNRMEELLLLAGWRVESEKVWAFKS